MTLLLHLALVLLGAPLLPGVIAKVKAKVAGRVGPPILQTWYDIVKLLRKGTVRSGTTTWIFFAGPAVSFVAALSASLLLPLVGSRAPFGFPGDMVLFVGLFALARFATTAAALDTGSAFEGMGAARELTFACLAEPALFFGLLALSRLGGSLELGVVLSLTGAAWKSSAAALVLILAAWFILLLAENCRVPFDDPNTHLELTMIHEVMVLDHGGPAFGVVLFGSSIKLFVFSALLAHVALPELPGPLLAAAATFAACVAVAVVVGLVESGMARLRLTRVPQLLVTASLVAGFAVVLVLR